MFDLKITNLSVMALCAASLAALLAFPDTGKAAMTLNVGQSGSNVLAIGSGTVNTAGLSFLSSANNSDGVQPGSGFFIIGGTANSAYTGISGPASFGPSNTFTPASSVSGDTFGLFANLSPPRFILPQNYVSNSPILAQATFNNQTISSLGLATGTYVYSWGSGPTADSLTINIPGVVPEPTSLSLLAAGAGTMLLLLRRRWQRRRETGIAAE